MKKKILLGTLAVATFGMAIGMMQQKSEVVKADDEWTTSTTWHCVNGAREVVEKDGAVRMMTDAWGVQHAKIDPVYLDGLSFVYKMTDTATASNTGFFFTEAAPAGFAYSGAVTAISYNRWCADQSRLRVVSSHDFDNDAGKIFTATDGVTAGFGSAGAADQLVIGNTDFVELKFTFAYVNVNWWSLTISEVGTSTFSLATANETTDGDGHKSTIGYISASELHTSEDGQCYMNVYGLSGYVTISDFVNGSALVAGDPVEDEKEIKSAAATSYVNGLNRDNYSASNWAAIQQLLADCLADINAATTVQGVDDAYDAMVAAIALVPMIEWVDDTTMWAVRNGAADVMKIKTDGDNNYLFDHFHSYSCTYGTQAKVNPDGLEFTMGLSGTAGSQYSYGFFFTQATNATYSGPVTTVWHALYPGQTRLIVMGNHDYNGTPMSYSSMDINASAGFGGQGGINIVANAGTYDIYKFKFEHVTTSWWSLTITETGDGTIWGDTANYNKDTNTGLASVVTYIKNSDMPLDENGEAYMNVYSASNANVTVLMKNYVNGSAKEVPADPIDLDAVKAEYKDKIDALVAGYPTDFTAASGDAYTTAFAAIDTATDLAGVEAAYNAYVSAVKTAYYAYLGYEGTIDANTTAVANMYGTWGQPNYAKRLDDKGDVIAYLSNGFGSRAEFKRSYDPFNMSVKLNLSDVAPGTVLFVNYDTVQQSYPSEATKFFHVEFYVYEAGKVQVVLGNSGAHNISIEEWYQSNNNTFTGRDFTIPVDGNFTITTAYDAETQKVTVTINEQSITVDAATLNYGKGNNVAYLQTGVINGDGNHTYVRFELADVASIAYAAGLANAVQAVRDEIAAGLSAVQAAAPTEMTDASYAAFVSSYNSQMQAIQSKLAALTSYDQAYYGFDVSGINAIKSEQDTAYATKISEARAAANEYIDNVDLTLYRDEEKEALSATLAEIKGALNEVVDEAYVVNTLNGIATLLQQAQDAVAATKTDAQLTAEEQLKAAKDAALAEINAINIEVYDDEDYITASNIIRNAKTAIEAATSIEAVQAAVQTAKDALALLKTAAQKALEAAKAEALETLNAIDVSVYDATDAATANGLIATAKTAVEAATTIEEVEAAVQACQDGIAQLKTAVQKALEAAQAQGLKDIEEFEATIDYSQYSEENAQNIKDLIAGAKANVKSAQSAEAIQKIVEDLKAAVGGVEKVQAKKGGCGGSIIAASAIVSLVSLAGFAFVSIKRKQD